MGKVEGCGLAASHTDTVDSGRVSSFNFQKLHAQFENRSSGEASQTKEKEESVSLSRSTKDSSPSPSTVSSVKSSPLDTRSQVDIWKEKQREAELRKQQPQKQQSAEKATS